ncbi:Phosphatidylserine decarboxylase proenzyme [Rubripirellula tenax]|uniref:phosphatidylserine decarboxylase n=1 Tax=Rubripirellula tenax TaxID=2528015 RepID=A0A5C6FIB2_9BACT|nr:archaetidylserine decarboxylase [Rubripirellula tenax]TWU60323.1 Phosphatidylserine decarboxylase proenzyme [Rubripirellula tenax]
MDKIVYYDRYRDEACVEKVYGDKALRWTYQTLGGRISLNVLVKRALFSHWYGWKMDRADTRKKILPFVQEFELDATEFVRDVDDFANFNEFFFRELKPDARPIDPTASSVVFPADGRHLCVPDLSRCDGLFVKGEMFNLGTLLDNQRLTDRYANGSLLLSRLCPVDYHRFHFPVAGVPGATRLINGPLYSVNPIALCQNIHILAKNKRCVTEVQTESFGNVLMIEVGATCVGSICQTYAEGVMATKGSEKGYFRFGGSSTIMIFESGRIQFDQDLVDNSLQHRELYAKVGDHMGTSI